MVKSSKELRSQFLSFFEKKGHKVVASSPLLPKDDPTLLFVNAGMVQFKDVFTGKEKRPYTRATSSQKCVRAGGKHNDLENVGRTARHHTLFEMLGNFSFGDYFKEEACLYAWEFLTKVLGLDPSKMSVTVFGGEGSLPADEEAERIWRDVVGLPASQISRKGAADNFWAMGDTGPCGPCTEIHYDRSAIKSSFGGDDAEGDTTMEFWNLVFMQFERKADGTLIPLPAPSVDTGMGLERLCTIINDYSSNYETDLLKPYVNKAALLSHKTYSASDLEDDVSMRVIADHSRTTAFLIADGVLPQNEGRGYVLRRIMRRAIRHGSRLGLTQLFFHEVCQEVVNHLGDVYPELKNAASLIQKVVMLEEDTFRKTLDRGLILFQESSAHLTRGQKLDGTVVFKLHETYGFPPDLTTTLAEENGLVIDWEQFETAKAAHEKASSGGLGLVGVEEVYKELSEKLGATEFLGDRDMDAQSHILALLKDGKVVQTLSPGESGSVILDKTSFYGESGGQVGDSGFIENDHCRMLVQDTKKVASLIVHLVTVEKGQAKVSDTLRCSVDSERREDIRRHHSVTHLLHAALRELLGPHVTQKGSLVAPDRLRFDFSHFEALSPEMICTIEDKVNLWIMENGETLAEQMTLDEAKALGAMALFGEKYGDRVRVVEMGSHSTELCGGTHVHRTGDIGFFKITGEGPLSAGIRRIEAVAGKLAVLYARREHDQLKSLSQVLGVGSEQLEGRVQGLVEDLKSTRRELDVWLSKASAAKAGQRVGHAREVNGIKVVTELVEDGSDMKALHDYADKLRDHLGSGVVVLGSETGDGKCSVLVALTKDLTGRYHAGKIVGRLAEIIGGKGGGRPDFAQAGGTKPEALKEALEAIDGLL
jgi:alanyl-tRNA synthetase